MSMQKFIGVTMLDLHIPTKRDLLLFDQIGVPLLDTALGKLDAATVANLEWLAERDVVIEADFSPDGSAESVDCATFLTASALATQSVKQFSGLAEMGIQKFEILYPHRDFDRIQGTDVERSVAIAREIAIAELKAAAKEPERLKTAQRRLQRSGQQLVVRTISHQLTSREVQAVPMLVDLKRGVSSRDPETVVLEVVIENFPQPDELTPLEKILDFRAEAAARGTLTRLRRWISEMAKEAHTAADLQLEIDNLVAEYRNHMKAYGIDSAGSTLKEVLAAAAKGNFGDAITIPFARKARLLKAELSAPGRELAYLVKARDHFG